MKPIKSKDGKYFTTPPGYCPIAFREGEVRSYNSEKEKERKKERYQKKKQPKK